MKVLAIRGHNLASLPELEVVLEEGPLSETGLFAITGPTGAGKSTLLDALCLALYDQTPRLLGQRDLPVGGPHGHAADPRSVLRRGTAEGRAEVDFEGRNGRFRAIWAVRRARRRADGKLQPQEMALFRLPDLKDLSGGTKTETLARIQAEVGLSFDEFRRAVLLAQGDFAAFLEARPDQRAELLEKMTGTALYGELSRAAFARAKEEAQRLEALEAKRAAIPELAAERRVSLLNERATRADQADALRVARDQARATLAKAELISSLKEELATAEAQLAEAQAERARRTAALPYGEDLPRLQKLRAPAQRQRQAEEAHQRAAHLLATATHQQQSTQSRRVEAQAQLAAQSRARQALLTEAERMAPLFARARTVDAELAAAEQQLTEQSEELARLEREGQGRREALALRERGLEAHKEKLEAVQAWLLAHPDQRALAAQWSRWTTELERLIEARAEQAARAAEATSLSNTRDQALAEVDRLRQEQVTIEQHLTEARARTQQSEAELMARRQRLSPKEVQLSLERLAKEQSTLHALGVALRDAVKLEKATHDDERAERAALAEQKQRRAELEATKQKRRQQEERLLEVEGELVTLESTEALSSRRAELLQPGQPCPLCGATEHPAAAHPSEKNPRLAVIRGQRTRLLGLLEELSETQRRLEVELAQQAELARTSRQRLLANQTALEERRSQWHRGHETVQLLWSEVRVPTQSALVRLRALLPERPDAKAGAQGLAQAEVLLTEVQAELRREVDAEQAQGAEVEARRREEDRIEHDRQRALSQLEQAKDRATQLEQTLAELRVRLMVVEARAKDAQIGLEEALQPWPKWQQTLKEDPAAFRRSASAAVEAWSTRVEEEQALLEAARSQAELLAIAAAEARAALDRREAAQRGVALLVERVAAQRLSRAQLLDGRPVEPLEAEQRAQLADAEAAWNEAQVEAEQAGLLAAAAVARHAAATEAYESSGQAQAEARAEMQANLQMLGLTESPTLRAFLEKPEAEVEAERLALVQLDAALETARITAADRRARLEAVGPGDGPSVAALAEVVSRAEEALEQNLLALGRVEAELRQDEVARQEAAALDPPIAAQRERLRAWQDISQVIGSADGKKLRTFAQSLSLEALVDAANQHLLQLRPRYRLERIPDVDMELLVVDRDLGEEPRAIASLSGGETFLVSLALALGLASLSAKDVRLGSLFIDEGFGSLDKEALELAISALDQLQAEGRTVGLISHIPDLAERIGYVVEVRPTAPGTSRVEIRRS